MYNLEQLIVMSVHYTLRSTGPTGSMTSRLVTGGGQPGRLTSYTEPNQLSSLPPSPSLHTMPLSICFDALGTCFTTEALVEALDQVMGEQLKPVGGARMIVMDWVSPESC